MGDGREGADPLLQIAIDDGQSSLAVRFEEPARRTADAAVLYIHGFGSRQTGTKAEYFRRRFTEHGIAFCSFDFQGHGASGGSMLGLTLSRNLADLAAMRRFLRERGHARIILMGSSMGGGTALWSAALDPEGIVAGVHIAPSLAMDEGVLSRISPRDAARWEREGELALSNESGSWTVGWSLITDLRRYDLARLYDGHRAPTLIFQGKKDDTVPWERALDFTVKHAAEQVELVLMADAEHRMVDRLDHLWRMAHSFLLQRGAIT